MNYIPQRNNHFTNSPASGITMTPVDPNKKLYPSSLSEALAMKEEHHQASVICTFTELLRQPQEKDAHEIIIDLSGVRDFDFFLEDHSHWFIGASFPLKDVLEMAKERIPALYTLTADRSQHNGKEIFLWLQKKHTRLHLSTKDKINIIDIDIVNNIHQLIQQFNSGIPCMMAVPKDRPDED